MAASSKHYLDVYLWIISIISSCERRSQICSVNRLISNFEQTYKSQLIGINLDITLRKLSRDRYYELK